MALFEARHLHKRFGRQVVLEDISLSFEAGRSVRNHGSERRRQDDVFNVLTGRYAPDRGEVMFDGQAITGMAPRQIARRGISRSFQIMNLFNDYSAQDNVLMALPEIRRAGSTAERPRADTRGAGQGGGGARAGRPRRQGGTPAKSLSYGERRALEIAVALASEPRLLFLDEPTAGLGSEGRPVARASSPSWKKTLTIVVIEHDMKFLFGLADRISVIHWGQVIAEGTPAELRENPWVRRSSLGGAA